MNRDGTCAAKFRSAGAHLWELVCQKEVRAPDLELRMHDRFPFREGQTNHFFRAKSLLIKLDGLTGAFHDQVRSNRVHAFRNCLDVMCHFFLFFRCYWLKRPPRPIAFLRSNWLICARFNNPTNERRNSGQWWGIFSRKISWKPYHPARVQGLAALVEVCILARRLSKYGEIFR